MKSPEIAIRFAGRQVMLHAHGVLYWPSGKTLVASDLHFEKSTFLAGHGALIPPYDTQDTLERLEQVIAYYQPERLILLGDSFHDARAWERLDSPLRARILALAQQVRTCIWIEGNHDAALQTHPLGVLTGIASFDGLHFAHDDSATQRPLIIGHYHPKTHIALKGRTAHGKCFIHSDTLLIMPSFGSYTGGLTTRHQAIQTLFAGQSPKTHLLYRGNIYTLPASTDA